MAIELHTFESIIITIKNGTEGFPVLPIVNLSLCMKIYVMLIDETLVFIT